MNVGEARGNFRIDGLVKSIRDLRKVKQGLDSASTSMKKSSTARKELLAAARKENTAARRTLTGVTTITQAQQRLNTELTRRIRKLPRVIALEERLAQIRKTASGFSTHVGREKAVQQRNATAQAARSKAVREMQANAQRLTAELKKQASAIRHEATEQRKLNDLFEEAIAHKSRMNYSQSGMMRVQSPGQIMRDRIGSMPGLSGITGRLGSMSGMFSKVRAKARGAGAGVKKFALDVRNLTRAVRGNSKVVAPWWKRFGLIAVGFTVAYRAINAMELAVGGLSRTFAAGISVMDEYVETGHTVAGMLALLSQGAGGYTQRFEAFSSVMTNTMQEAIRLAPKYRMSMDDIGNGLKELAQFGVVVTKDMTESTLNAFAMIKRIAATTDSSAKQVRQELQALFSGRTRVTDQFGRMIKNQMPEVADKIFGIAAANKTNAEKWELVIDKMWDFHETVVEINKTLRGQGEIALNSLKVISSQALKTSSIYDKWSEKLQEFNKGLFTQKGKLGDLGKRFYTVYYRIWQFLDKIADLILDAVNGLLSLYHTTVELLKPISGVVKWYLKWVGTLFVLKVSLSTILGLMKLMMKLTFLDKFLRLGKILFTRFTYAAVAIGVVVVAVAVLYSNIRALQYAWEAIVEYIKAAGVHAILVFERKVKQLWFNIQSWFSDKPLKIAAPIPDALNDKWKEAGDRAAELYGAGFEQGLRELKAKFVRVASGLKDTISGLMDTVLGSDLSNQVKDNLGAVVDQIESIIDKFSNWGDVKFPSGEELAESLEGIYRNADKTDETVDKLKTMAEYISGEFHNVIDGVLKNDIRSLGELWDETLLAMRNAFADAINDMITEWMTAGLKEMMGGAFDKGPQEFFSSVGGALAGAFSGGSEAGSASGAASNSFNYGNFSVMGADNPNSKGGIIDEPVFGFGLRSGETWSFAEEGPERVLSNMETRRAESKSVYQVNVPVNVQNGNKAMESELRREMERVATNVVRKHS